MVTFMKRVHVKVHLQIHVYEDIQFLHTIKLEWPLVISLYESLVNSLGIQSESDRVKHMTLSVAIMLILVNGMTSSN